MSNTLLTEIDQTSIDSQSKFGKILEQSSNLENMTEEEQGVWLQDSGQVLSSLEVIEDLSIMAQAAVLYEVHKHWEKGTLKREATAPWSYEFYVWAKSFTKRRAIAPAETTIANKITVYRDWVVSDEISPPPTVYLPRRNEKGDIVEVMNPDEDWIEVPFDPTKADYGKLLIARAAAKQNLLSEDTWAALMDPFVTSRSLKDMIYRDKAFGTEEEKEETSSNSSENLDMRLFESEGILYATQGGINVALCVFSTENANKELYRRGVALLLQAFGLRPSPEVFEDGEAEIEIIK